MYFIILIELLLLFLGLEPQAKEVPFRFLVKQLLVEKNRVIFTGTYIYVVLVHVV